MTTLELCDPSLFHLDMALGLLPDGTALVCESALTEPSLRVLERAPGIREVVTVPRADALAFGLNWLAIGDTIVVGARIPRIESIVTSRGYRYVCAPLEQFHLAGGSASCLAAIVHPEPPPEVSTAPPARRRGVDLYGSVFRSMLFPVWETRVRQRPVVERWKELNRTQWRWRDELAELQRDALARLLRHAYEHVPLYRARFDALGATPDDIRTPADLALLPVVRRRELQACGTAWESTVAPLPTIRKQTSGTTGEPLLFGYEPDSEHWRRAVKLRGYEWAGYRPGDRALHFWGAPEPSGPPWSTRLKIAPRARYSATSSSRAR